jgi:cob(I)alamin adenosyltransferase
VAISHLPNEPIFLSLKEQLETIQHALFDLGAALATPRTTAISAKIEKTRFDSEGIVILEKAIDTMEESLPSLKTFILPGGHPAGAALHLARSICRRAERLITPIHKNADVSSDVLVYLNRLSDYLFVLSRYVNQLANCPETAWQPHKLCSL